MKKLIYLIAVVSSSLIFGQEAQNSSKNEYPSDSFSNIYEEVDKEAEFPGGLNAFRSKFAESFNHKNIKVEKRKAVFRIVISFIVERDGSLTNITAEGDYVKFMEEAIASVKRVKDKWSPALINSQPVRQRFRMPITMNFD